MSTLKRIYTNPKEWKIDTKKVRLKDTNEECLKVTYGEYDDDMTGINPLEMYIRKRLFEKLTCGDFHISREDAMNGKISIRNSKEQKIKPALEDSYSIFCY